MDHQRTYHIRTDAVHFYVEAGSAEAALATVIEQNEWAALDSAQERRDIADGAWLLITSDEASDGVRRGRAP